MYYNGKGVEIDYKEAIHFFKLSATQGYARAVSFLKDIDSEQQLDSSEHDLNIKQEQ